MLESSFAIDNPDVDPEGATDFAKPQLPGHILYTSRKVDVLSCGDNVGHHRLLFDTLVNFSDSNPLVQKGQQSLRKEHKPVQHSTFA
jgi:hypothetical protein